MSAHRESRSDAPKIAQRFSAGFHARKTEKSRQGRKNGSVVPDGTCRLLLPDDPALKRWAIFVASLRDSRFRARARTAAKADERQRAGFENGQ